ncbi:progestin and adipoQ receptor family member 3-like [Tropilaelaps mercedesae]|uniref:Progestin and adipoQ receptor family member 3-like n=1 Tax=Tropilaelaps mercedesae TaxID=418985 RepID=A0A1V9WZI9_9ACAR|nr:progestin and adipoQ receptor family member 3-like [Tropilaelaps mercedesae]
MRVHKVYIPIPQQENPAAHSDDNVILRSLYLTRLLNSIASIRIISDQSETSGQVRHRRKPSQISQIRCGASETLSCSGSDSLQIQFINCRPPVSSAATPSSLTAEAGSLQRVASDNARKKRYTSVTQAKRKYASMPNLSVAGTDALRHASLARANSEELLPSVTLCHRRKSTGSYFKELCLECKNGLNHCACPEVRRFGSYVQKDIAYLKERLLRAPSLEDVCGADDDSKPLTTDYEHARHFMKNNPYITHGYRTFKSKERCIRGIFRWNNETLNIWTNFVALVGILALYATDLLTNYSSTGFNAFDKTLSGIMILGYSTMLSFSSIYHIFNCCCYRCHRYWYFWDFVGIVTSVYVYGVGFLFLQFRRDPFWIGFYGLVMSVIAVIPIAMTFSGKFAHERYDESRSIWIGGFVLFSCVPIVHYFILQGGLASLVVKHTLPLHVVVIALLVASYIIYETKVPERMFPGKVNYVGSSHQLWHCGVGVSVFIARLLYFRYIEAFKIVDQPLSDSLS